MTPLFPSLIPKYVDESWFVSDQPVDEAARLNELEANENIWSREEYRNVNQHTAHVEPVDDDANDDEDDEEINDDEEEEDDMEEGDDIEEEFMANDSPPAI